MPLQLTVLGSSGTYAGPGDACSGYLVECYGYRMLVDVGPGVLANAQAHCSLKDIDAIVVSHAHPDHWSDLPTLRNALLHVFGRSDLSVLGPADVLSMLESVVPSGVAPTFRWHVTRDGDEVHIGPYILRFSQTDHPGETLAVRVDGGDASLAYSADTGPGWSFNELGTEIDLALCESSYCDADRERTGGVHLTAWQAGALGRLADVRHLVLTHIVPTGDRTVFRSEGAEGFGAPVHLAAPHVRFDL